MTAARSSSAIPDTYEEHPRKFDAISNSLATLSYGQTVEVDPMTVDSQAKEELLASKPELAQSVTWRCKDKSQLLNFYDTRQQKAVPIRVRREPRNVREVRRAFSPLWTVTFSMMKSNDGLSDEFKLGADGCRVDLYITSDPRGPELSHFSGAEPPRWADKPAFQQFAAANDRALTEEQLEAGANLASVKISDYAKYFGVLIGREASLARLLGARGAAGRWEQALGLLRRARRAACEVDAPAYNAAITAVGRGVQWRPALQLLRDMRASWARAWERAVLLFEQARSCRLELSLLVYSGAASACKAGLQWAQALALLGELRAGALRPSAISCSGVMSACERGHQWRAVLHLLGCMGRWLLQPPSVAYAMAVRACEAGRHLSRVRWLFHRMQSERVVPEAALCNASVSACGRHQEWAAALALFLRLRTMALRCDAAAHGAAVHACGRLRRWRQALRLLGAAAEPSAAACGAAVSACERSAQWRQALHALRLADRSGLSLTTVALNAGIAACARGHRWDQAITLVGQMRRLRITRDTITKGSLEGAKLFLGALDHIQQRHRGVREG
ncbi:unnamed protein product [Prorocentrum cordatum]|uniref:Pentatricopeptide repeat-containing protein, chloroplastic n=1 Tax=Prorocentrum cordatum TaxID=2364126 RepID=A0ABN9TI73_9DINO|nr:unnamed protein product [Polarella glacialis]